VTKSVTGTARILLAAAAILAAPWLAQAQGTPSSEEARKRLQEEKIRLDAKEKLSKDLEAGIDKLAAERERISARLIETGKLIQQSEVQLNGIEARLGDLDAEEQRLRGALEQRHGAISTLLAALQRIGRNPPPVMVTRREDALTMVRSAMLLSSAFPELRGEAERLTKDLRDLARVIKSSRAEGEKLRAEKARHDEARVRLAALQDEKRRSSAHQQRELQGVRQEVARIATSVKEMNDFLHRLDKELVSRLPAATAKEVTAVDPNARPSGEGDRKAVAVLAPSGERVAMLAPSRIKPNIPFDQAKGVLQLPSQGRRILSFGQKTTFGTQSKGIGIQTRYGGAVVSPCDGLIVYAGEFRTYGQLLIISPGGGYHVLLAGLSQIDVQVGQSVLMGEPVGVMSAAAKSQAAQESGGPVLTIEFRKDQRPIDPDPWWSDASRKVQQG
jgi:septal ring factor EnvC (AmiA/AmiB activator)